jgi:Animal haem peroxidase
MERQSADRARSSEAGRITGVSRRSFLRGLGGSAVGAGAYAATHGAATLGGHVAEAQTGRSSSPLNFGRMFPSLPPFAADSEALQAALTDIGRPGGLLDANDNLAAGPVELILDPALSVNNVDNTTHTAGTTFLGQFLDHDVTFDAASPLGVPTDPQQSRNTRTPSLDLDSLYGGGPTASPALYQSDRTKLRIESGGQFEDVPRDGSGRAIISDPRNDENVIIAGLQAAMIKFHNRVVDIVRAERRTLPSLVFTEARRRVTWHYQWIVVREFLPQIIGQSVIDNIFQRGRRWYRPPFNGAFMPVEFQGAAYRFGHSMVRPSYRANLAGDNGAAFFGMIFDPAGQGQADPVDLRGGARAPRRFIGWQTFFDFGDGEVKPNKIIDTHLSTPLFDLPLGAIASGQPPTSLPVRNLLRHITWSQPSGQAIARTIGATPLSSGDLSELAAYGLGLERSTPLWYYILKEAELVTDGLRLGPVGARIVGEVFIGILQLQPDSYLNRFRWRPNLPRRSGSTGDYRMVDLLTLAGVDPTSRGQ